MPCFAVFAASAQVGHGEDTAHFHPGKATDAEPGGEGNVEPAVAVEESGVVTVEFQPFFVADEHGDAGAVLAGVEHLGGLVVIGIEIHIGPGEEGAFAGDEVVAIGAGGRGKAGERVKSFRIGAFATETAPGPNAREIDFANELSGQIMQSHCGLGILQVIGNKKVAHDGDAAKGIPRFGDEFFPVRLLRFSGVDGDDPAPGCIEIGLEEEEGTVIADEGIVRLELADEVNGHAVGFGEVAVEHPVFVIRAFGHRHNEITAIFGDGRTESPLGVIRPVIDQSVARLIGADPVIVQFGEFVDVEKGPFGRFIVPGVEEAPAILRPGGSGPLDPAEGFGQIFAGVQIADFPGFPVGPGFGPAVGHEAAIIAERGAGEGHGAILRP